MSVIKEDPQKVEPFKYPTYPATQVSLDDDMEWYLKRCCCGKVFACHAADGSNIVMINPATSRERVACCDNCYTYSGMTALEHYTQLMEIWKLLDSTSTLLNPAASNWSSTQHFHINELIQHAWGKMEPADKERITRENATVTDNSPELIGVQMSLPLSSEPDLPPRAFGIDPAKGGDHSVISVFGEGSERVDFIDNSYTPPPGHWHQVGAAILDSTAILDAKFESGGEPSPPQKSLAPEVGTCDVGTLQDMNAVSEALISAGQFNLQVEVVHSALDAMKGNPTQTISDAIFSGLEEWVK